MRGPRVILGAIIWTLIVLGLWNAWSNEEAVADPEHVAENIWTYYSGDYQPARLTLSQVVDVAVGDPIFYVGTDGSIDRIGEVRAMTVDSLPARRGYVDSVEAVFYPNAPPLTSATPAEYFSADQSLIGAMRMMFPPEKRKAIAQLIVAAYEEHNQEIAQEMWPIVHATLKEAMLTLEKELAISFANHREELRAVGARYQQEIITDDVIPLVREEVWPIVRRRAEPVANQMGKEIWERVSIWRFGWRMLYDKTPLLPTRNYTEKEWKRFVDAEFVPVLERHTDDLVQVTQGILRDVGKNEKVRDALRKNLNLMLDDPDVQRILGEIIREVVIERDNLRETFKKTWSTPESQQALRLVSDRLEPTARKIGALIVGTREEISPDFALVLRNYALAKDRRWICIYADEQPAETADRSSQQTAEVLTLHVNMGESTELNPFVNLVNRPAGR